MPNRAPPLLAALVVNSRNASALSEENTGQIFEAGDCRLSRNAEIGFSALRAPVHEGEDVTQSIHHQSSRN